VARDKSLEPGSRSRRASAVARISFRDVGKATARRDKSRRTVSGGDGKCGIPSPAMAARKKPATTWRPAVPRRSGSPPTPWARACRHLRRTMDGAGGDTSARCTEPARCCGDCRRRGASTSSEVAATEIDQLGGEPARAAWRRCAPEDGRKRTASEQAQASPARPAAAIAKGMGATEWPARGRARTARAAARSALRWPFGQLPPASQRS